MLSCIPVFAQDSNAKAIVNRKYTVSGYIKDATTGEVLIGAGVYIKELKRVANTNTYGFYSITLDKGTYTLQSSFLGYQNSELLIYLNKDLRINIDLHEDVATLQEVEITSEKGDKNVQSTEMGTFKVNIEEIKKLPAFMGEVDVLKAIQLLPGVQSAGDGNSGFYVRGGGPDQNLILLDEAVVYNASHLLGFFSVFNADIVKNVELTKGNMPAAFGGRLSSVLDISTKEGNAKKFQVDGGIGLISSRLTVQGPIKKDTSSFIVSARRTYIDVLIQPFISKTSPTKGSSYYFYDLNAKVNYMLSDKNRLYLSGYFGRDVFTFNNSQTHFDVNVPWGNATASLRWNHLFSSKLFMNASAIYTNYKFEFGANQNQFEFKLFSGISDWNGKLDFNYFVTEKYTLKFGFNYIFHTFTPSNVSAKSGEVVFDTGKIIRLYAHDAAVYVSNDYKITDKLELNAGLRYSVFQQIGPFTRFVKEDLNTSSDTIYYKAGKAIATYGGIEPRIALRYRITESASVKAGFTRNNQYIHLASISTVSLPTDVWFPSTTLVKPQLATQYALGYFQNFHKNTYESSVEVYYKKMDNLVEYKEGATPEADINNNPDNNFTFGKGWSYGAEFFFKKRLGKLNGWIGYTLAWTNRLFNGTDPLNNGNVFPAKYDRRHDVSVVATYNFNKKWTASAVFIYATGNAGTLATGRYLIEEHLVSDYGDRNSYRFVPYHRLDLSVTYTPDREKRNARRRERLAKKSPTGWNKLFNNYESSWNFSVFNVYNRHNPYFIYFNNEGNVDKGELHVSAHQVSLFPILPSISWNFKF